MIEEPKALTIQEPSRRPSDAQIAAFQGVPTGFVVDAMFGGGSLDTKITPLEDTDAQVAGPALTADNRPSDILALLAALAFVQSGDIVVSAVAGFQGCAAAGDRVVGMAKNGGAAGFITDGPMRDYAGIVATGIKCWCTGLNPGSPYSTGPGKVGTPVVIGGQRVETGDMIIADRDGVVVVPFAQIDAVIAALEAVRTSEEELDAKVFAGLNVPPAIEELLASDAVARQT